VADFISQLEVADEAPVEAAVKLFDRFLHLAAQQFVSAGDHILVGHHVVVESLLDDVFGDHATHLGAFVKEGEVTIIVQVEFDNSAGRLSLESKGRRGPDFAHWWAHATPSALATRARLLRFELFSGPRHAEACGW